MWTLETAVPVARQLEALLVPLKAHVALGGSVLRDGASGKDLDLFVYSHGVDVPVVGLLRKAIGAHLGCDLVSALENKKGERYADATAAAIYVANLPDGRRVDLFFMAKVIE